MSEMVERVAMAIMRDDFEGHDFWDRQAPDVQNQYLTNARAAIAAMREPTESMVVAGEDHIGGDLIDGDSAWVWQAMVDEALK